MNVEEDTLNITPSFKSRSSKGKGRATPRASAVADNEPSNGNLSHAASNEDDDDAGNSSAVLFKKSASKSKGKSLLGGATTSTASTSSSARKATARSRLNVSFGGDDEGDSASRASSAGVDMADESMNDGDISVSEVRKLNKKNRRLGGIGSSSLNKAAEKALSNSLSQATITSLADRASSTAASTAGPSYSNDYLNELKAANVSKSAPVTTDDLAEDSMFGQAAGDSNGTSLARYGVDDDDFTVNAPTEKLLPTEDAIITAKVQRETARRLGIDNPSAPNKSEDFISLQVGMPTSKRESRLVREEDELGEAEDDFSAFTGAQERVALGKKGQKAMERKRKDEMRALIEGTQEDDDVLLLGGKGPAIEEDEEEREWELAQIRRGEQRRGAAAGDDDGEPYRPASIPEQQPLPTLIGTTKRLKNALSELEALKLEDDEHLRRSEAELGDLEAQENDLKIQVESTNLKFEFFAELKAYIQDVASFLSAKYPLLEKMESDNVAFMKERTHEIVGRRRILDDADDVALFTGVAIKVDMKDKKEKDGEDMETDEQDGGVDDMGRSRREDDIEPKSLARRTRRQERARRRTLASGNASVDEEGFATDDDLLASDAADLTAAGSTLATQRENIFQDVESEEFKDPNQGIKVKFLDWKKRYPQDYKDAFAGLSLVQAWEFWIRVEMASWNPLGVKELPQSPPSLDAYTWHASLTAYQEEAETLGIAAGTNGFAPTSGEDDSVVNAAVATIILPRLRKLAVEAYDPFSRSMTSKALHVVEEISYCLETSNQRFQHLILGFLAPFQVAIHNFQQLVQQAGSAIASPEIAIDMEAIQARQRFLQRQLKLLFNAVRWRRYSKGLILAQGQGAGAGAPFEACLINELVIKCMLPVVEAAWDTGGREVGQKILTVLGEGSLPPDIARRLQRA